MSQESDSNINRLTNTQMLATSSIWNMLGQGIPLLISIFSIPLLIKGLGVDRYGILSLVLILIGYFSIFDLGMSRALTKFVAERIGAGQETEIPTLVYTALLAITILAIIGSLTLVIFSSLLVTNILKIPDNLKIETLHSLYLIAICLPIVILTTGLKGVLEAHQLFRALNLIRIPMGIYNSLAPLLVLPFTTNLVFIVAILVLGRIFGFLAHLYIYIRILVHYPQELRFNRELITPLFTFGGWLTVSNIIAPIMLYLDRFLIGTLLPIAAVSYYTIPYDMVTKLWIIPNSIMAVMFPAFSTTLQYKEHLSSLYKKTMKSIFFIVSPIVLICILFAKYGLTLWLGTEFASNSVHVLQLLSIGVLINCMAQPPFTLLQASGHPEITAKIHLVEMPFYLSYLWWLTSNYGIEGAALAWVVRVTINCSILNYLASRHL